MLEVTENHLEIFKQIKDRFLPETDVPEQDSWKSWTNNKIWIELIIQIMVVKSSAENVEKEFKEDRDRQSRVSYEKLIQIEDDDKLQREIQQVLDEVGVFASRKKANALVHNLKQLKSKYGDPKSLFEKLSKLSDEEQINSVREKFDQIGLKGARDYLMEAGLIRDAIAFDSRVISILKEVGLKLPKKFETNPKKYAEAEKDVLEKICKPLGLLGVEFDRMLFQNKDKILEKL